MSNRAEAIASSGDSPDGNEINLKHYLDIAEFILVAFDAQARITLINRKGCHILGYKEEELLGRDWFKVCLRPEDYDRVFHVYQAIISGNLEPFEYHENYILTKGKESRYIAWHNALIRDKQGRITGTFSSGEDITDRKQAEEQRRKLEAQMLQAQKMESLGLLAGGIAHDFNNLLTGVLGNVELALQDISPLSPIRDNLADIQKSARRAAELCRQMLAYSGRGRFVIQSIDLRELVREMGQMLEVSISKKTLLRYRFADAVPPIEADPTQIRQVLMNMIINASESIGETAGMITIAISTQECDRAYLDSAFAQTELPPGLYVSLEISDTGCGMTEATRLRIFEPFFTTKFTGRGLGLAAVLGIVRGHKGAIMVYSEPGKGTTFKILLPAINRTADKLTEQAGGSLTWKGSGTVLLADDEEPVRTVGKRVLEKMGFQVILAVDGRDAVDRFYEQEQIRPGSIACVLLDLTMPHKSGEEVFREIRTLRPEVPVLLCSGYNEQEVTQQFLGKGLTGFIQKPYQLKLLAAKLQAALDVHG